MIFFLILTGPSVLHEELLQHDVPEPLVEDDVALLDEGAVGADQRVVLHLVAAVERNLLSVGYNPERNRVRSIF